MFLKIRDTNMTYFSTTTLLNLLIALLELQVIAIRLKYQSSRTIPKSVYLPYGWVVKAGICYNITTTLSYKRTSYCKQMDCLHLLFLRCPSFSGSTSYPVQNKTINRRDAYLHSTPHQMWGDDEYADNRRQIIQECIDQLHTELKLRHVNVG